MIEEGNEKASLGMLFVLILFGLTSNLVTLL